MSNLLRKFFSKEFGRLFFIDIFPHIIVCTILSILNYHQAIAIFFVGLILPDFLTAYAKLPGKAGTYTRRKRWLDAAHGITLIISVVAIFYNYPLIGLAGIIHVILDEFGL